MAVTRKNKSSALLLSVQTGTDTVGKPTYSTRVISSIDTALSDDDAHTIGTELAALQSHTLGAISRSERAKLEQS